LIELPEGAVVKIIATIHGRDNEILYAKIEIPKNKLQDFDSKIGFSYKEVPEEEFAGYKTSYPCWSRFRWNNIKKKSIIKVIIDTKGGGHIIYVYKDIDNIELFFANDCLNYIGCCYLMLEDFDSAFEVFERLIKLAPDWERPVFNLGRVYLQSGRLKEALECFNKAAGLNPYNEDSYFYLGIYYYKIGDCETSRKYYKKSLK